MRVVVDKPPLFDEIDTRFKIAGKPVIFAWWDRIFNPMNVNISPEIFAHEAVHLERQTRMGDILVWWHRYIDDDAFRLMEEVPAHRAEYDHLIERHGSDRNTRRRCLNHVALKLCSPIYGRMVALHEAKKLILA